MFCFVFISQLYFKRETWEGGGKVRQLGHLLQDAQSKKRKGVGEKRNAPSPENISNFFFFAKNIQNLFFFI